MDSLVKSFRVREAADRDIRIAARLRGKTYSTYVREAALARARRDLGDDEDERADDEE